MRRRKLTGMQNQGLMKLRVNHEVAGLINATSPIIQPVSTTLVRAFHSRSAATCDPIILLLQERDE